MNDLEVETYYKKLLYYSRGCCSHNVIKDNKNRIKYYLNIILSSEFRYLFTESLICFLATDDNIINKFKYCCSEENREDNIYYLLSFYYDNIISDYYWRKEHKKTYKKYVSIQTDDIKNATMITFKYDNMIFNRNNLSFSERKLLTRTLILTLSYCHLNKKMNEFDSISDLIINNLDRILDDFILNGIDIENSNYKKQLIYKIGNLIETQDYKRIIR